MAPAIFLDRDGTIIIDKNYLNDPQGVEFLPNAIEGLKKMRDKGFKLIVVTNQSGVARGLVTLENLQAIHDRMDVVLNKHTLKIDAYYFSPHAADSDHPTRKPNPGMIEQAILEHDIDRSRSWMIGDKDLDVQAGKNARVKTMLIAWSVQPVPCAPDFLVKDLLEASRFI